MSHIDSGSLPREYRVDTSLTGVALKILVIGPSGRPIMRNLTAAEDWVVATEIARKRTVRSSWLRHSSNPSMMITVG